MATETLESLEKQLAEAREHKAEVDKMMADTDGWDDVPQEAVDAFVKKYDSKAAGLPSPFKGA